MKELALAIDFETREELLAAVTRLGSARPVLKLGLRLLPHLSQSDIRALKDQGFRIFIDVKLHDIPSQVSSAVRTWAAFGADFVTIHTSGGRAMIREAILAARGTSVRILGVTVLTSLDNSDLTEMGLECSVGEQVARLVQLSRSEGLNSFVCSAQEIVALKRQFPDIYLCTPGLHIDDSLRAVDQKRGLHYRDALAQGADLLVMGRAVWQAAEPERAVAQVMGDL